MFLNHVLWGGDEILKISFLFDGFCDLVNLQETTPPWNGLTIYYFIIVWMDWAQLGRSSAP